MISSVEIKGFRGIREGKIDGLTPLVVLAGPNGCGKSSVLDALLIAGSRSVKDGIAQAVRRHEGVRYGARWLFWRPSSHESCEIKIGTDRNGQRTCTLTAERPEDWAKFPVQCNIQENFAGTSRGARIRLEFARGNTVAGASVEDLGTPQEEFAGVRLLESHREDPEAPLYELITKTTELGTIGQVSAILRRLVSGATDLRILTEGNEPLVQIVYEDHSVPAALAGDGIYSLLRLSLELASRPNGTVLLEEPEVHQHPGAVRLTVRAILAAVRRDIQVVLTTHSLELIDAILAESSEEDVERLSLYRLNLEDGRLKSRRMPGSEVAFSRCDIEKDLR